MTAAMMAMQIQCMRRYAASEGKRVVAAPDESGRGEEVEEVAGDGTDSAGLGIQSHKGAHIGCGVK
jgi:hypothetical protein